MDNDKYQGDNHYRFLIRDDWEQKLCNVGVPRMCWKPNLSNLKFKPVTLGPDKLTGIAQRQWIKSLAMEPPKIPPLVVVTSSPTDTGALYLAHFLIQYSMRQHRNVAVWDTAFGQPRTAEKFPHIILLHNILNNATPDRVQTVRDLTNRYVNAFRIVVVVAAENPYKWCRFRLGKIPTMVFQVEDLVIL